MIRHPTTFVVGAGASVDYGFPLGPSLTKQIDEALHFNSHAATTELMRTAISMLQYRPELLLHSVQLFEQARAMRAALATQVSIDYFLYSRSDQKHFELLGKIAIAACLITAESGSLSLLPRRPGELIDLSLSERSWLARLFKNVLAPGIRKAEMKTIFDNVSFIVFNYDRCIEHYLTHALASHFSVDLSTAAAIVSERLRIVHPYGSLGPLYDAKEAVMFGHYYRPETHEAADGLYAMSQRLLTFTESQKARAAEAKEMMEHAVRLVFLGFGFGDQNMELLRPSRTNIREIRGTVKGLSKSNTREVEQQIYSLTGQTLGPDDLQDCDCSLLITDEQMFLTRR
ncbi:MAG: hypothetical protein EPO10_01435 [Reyranella sp.]|uniref:hypothetical protein n=1 Tax=Reyranella sp. TaxID=1929291 RepID=UPI00120F45FA|nr:hypothetical protein [Reyranella sp.]TAJ88504.1 MAG: hypothetical protein EPO41_20485 [Reyranella sp.]TBR30713.1 MAG: hypothetical protein EPO10_01435 [Reyranella sp.]